MRATLIVQGKRPRARHYQVCRFVDGPKLMLTATSRGRINVYLCYQRFPKPGLIVEDWRKADFSEAAQAIDTLVRCGYDPIAIADRLCSYRSVGR